MHTGRIWLFCLVWLVSACGAQDATPTGTGTGTGDSATPRVVGNRPPIVEVRDRNLLLGESGRLLANAEDLDDDPLTFSWSIRSAPPLSEAELLDPDTAEVGLTPDRAGTYVLDVAVSDGEHVVVASGLLSVLATDEVPESLAGEDRIVVVGNPVTLDGSLSAKTSERYLFYLWSLIEAPEGAYPFFEEQEPIITFTPSVVGDYRLRLSVHNGSAEATDDVVVEARPDEFSPGDVPNAAFEPGQVYLASTVGPCAMGVAHWSDGNTLAGVIDTCQGAIASLRLDADGQLLYLQQGQLRRLVCDGCPDWRQADPLPKNPADNDPVVKDAECLPKAAPTSFAVDPDGGLVLGCSDGSLVDSEGRRVLAEGAVLAYGHGRALTNQLELVDLATGEQVAITDLRLAGQVYGVRVRPDGFWVATEELGTAFLQLVDPKTGQVVKKVIEYPAPAFTGGGPAALDEDGSLYTSGTDWSTGHVVITRRRLDGVNYAPYTTSASPPPWLGAPERLVTGP